ncbi:MAG: (d)CMP kinase [Bdellovibrionales bacterium]
MNPVITIDGPSASGKSSVSRELARRLGWKWVSTGAFYRGLAYVAFREGMDLNDAKSLVKLSQSSDIWHVRMDDDQTRVYYRGEEITDSIGMAENALRASQVSQLAEVREALLANQRACNSAPGLVAEGRDCGTVVFPEAVLKVYLTASERERASRRAREQGLDVSQTQSEQKKRDQQDSMRTAAPLKIPEDAKVVDSGGMPLDKVVDQIHEWALQALAQSVKSF